MRAAPTLPRHGRAAHPRLAARRILAIAVSVVLFALLYWAIDLIDRI